MPDAPPPLPKSQPSFTRRHSTIFKLAGVGALILLLLIPLAMIEGRPALKLAWNLLARLLMLSVVLVGWIFFRATSWASACDFLKHIVTWSQEGTRLVSPMILPALAVVVLVHLVVNKDRNWALELPNSSVPVRIAGYTVLALLIVCLGATDSAPFIYFQF